jgi:hypothetical protein
MEHSLATGVHFGEGTLMATDRNEREMSQFFNETEVLETTVQHPIHGQDYSRNCP